MKIIYLSFIAFILCSCTKPNNDVVLQSITIEANTTNITASNTLQLIPVFTPSVFENIPVVWSTSNDQVATVDATGLVTGVSSGQAIITVKDANGSISGECKVTVTQ